MKGREHAVSFVRQLYLLLLILMFISGTLFAQQDFTVTPMGHLGGYAGGAAVVGDHVFLVQGTMLTVLYNNGENLQKVASLALPNEPGEIIAAGNYLYLSGSVWDDIGRVKMQVIDISDPENPDLRTSFVVKEISNWVSTRIFVDGSYLYLTLADEFKIFDISDHAAPQVVSTVAAQANNIFVRDSLAFISGSEKFSVYNISDKQNITELGSCDIDRAVSAFVQEHFAYVGVDNYPNIGLQIIDIANPATPSKLGFLATKVVTGNVHAYKSPQRVVVSGDYAYVGTRGAKANLFIINIADSSAPAETGRLDINQGAFPGFESLQLIYPYLYFATGASSFQFMIANVMDPANPEIEQIYEEPWDIQALVASGDTLFVSSFDRIWAYDFSDTSKPVLAGSDTSWAKFSRMEIRDGYLYGIKENEFVILDVHDPGNIFEVGRDSSEVERILEMSILGHFAYLLRVSDNKSFLEALDISDPANLMKENGEYTLPGDGRDLCLQSDSLFALVAYYASDADQGFEIIDIADSSNFSKIGSAQTSGNPVAIDVKDTLAVVASNSTDSWFWEAYNTGDSAHPEKLGGPTGEGNIADIAIHDDGLIVASIPNGSLHYYTTNFTGAVFNWMTKAICHSPYSTLFTSMIFSKFNLFFSIDGFFGSETKYVSGSWGIFIQKLLIAAMLANIEVHPDEANLSLGDTLDFNAVGHDDSGNEKPIAARWSATGGQIDPQKGKYVATETGNFTVTATDTISGVSGTAHVSVTATGVIENNIVPKEFCLSQNYPNPFNPSTTIEFGVKEKCLVQLKIFDIRSREVAAPVNGYFRPGIYRVNFDGSRLPSGIYFYRIRMKNFTAVKKMLLLE